MLFTETKLADALVQEKILTKKEADAACKEAHSGKKSLDQVLLEKNLTTEDQLSELRARLSGFPFVKLKTLNIRKDILNLIPEPIASSHQLIAFDKTNDVLKIATLDPDDLQTFEFLRKRTGLQLDISLTTPSDLREVLKLYHKSLKAEFEELTKPEIPSEQDHEKLKAKKMFPK